MQKPMTTVHKPTIFVLDDDPAIQDSFATLFQVMKLPAEFFRTVGEFLDVYDPERPGCLLLDLRLPGDGFELLKKFSKSDNGPPIIVITGHGDSETKDQAIKLGATAYFEKPCDNQALCDCIQRLLQPTS